MTKNKETLKKHTQTTQRQHKQQQSNTERRQKARPTPLAKTLQLNIGIVAGNKHKRCI
jgi:hypothetical protein